MDNYRLLFLTWVSWLIALSTSVRIEPNYEVLFFDSEEQQDESFGRNVEDLEVNFMLFTRNHRNNFYLLQVENNESISSSDFDPNKDTKIIIHGWRNNYNSNFSSDVRNAYLDRYDANVINVDWSAQSYKNYISSRLDVNKVADVVAQMVDLLVTEFGMNSSRVHMIGHSLGAHVAGIAGIRLTTGNVSRITGLDPALPMFTVYENTRLRADSADFVDVIHSCGNFLGFKSALGQVDFYPNGGTFVQPGCGFDYKGKCSHGRSYNYFVESIKSNSFKAVKCENWDSFARDSCNAEIVEMGEYVPRTARGNFYLTTNSKAPFARSDLEYPDPTQYPEDPLDEDQTPGFLD